LSRYAACANPQSFSMISGVSDARRKKLGTTPNRSPTRFSSSGMAPIICPLWLNDRIRLSPKGGGYPVFGLLRMKLRSRKHRPVVRFQAAAILIVTVVNKGSKPRSRITDWPGEAPEGATQKPHRKCSHPCGKNSYPTPFAFRRKILRPRVTMPICVSGTPARCDGTRFPGRTVNNNS